MQFRSLVSALGVLYQNAKLRDKKFSPFLFYYNAEKSAMMHMVCV